MKVLVFFVVGKLSASRRHEEDARQVSRTCCKCVQTAVTCATFDTCAVRTLQVQREHHLPPGDFPDVARFREILSAFDFMSFPKVTDRMIKQIDDVLSVD